MSRIEHERDAGAVTARSPRFRPGAFALALAVALPTGQGAAFASPLLVSTGAGPVQGLVSGRMRSFRGIPFASPPVGPLRWRAPQPVAPWTVPLQADRQAASCAQSDTLGNFAAPSETEDCLYLNVFAPRRAKAAKAPVLVWIYGGGLRAGSAADYDPSALVRQGLVVVTFNYRVGALGYFAHPALKNDLAQPNLGMLDQIAVLRWVKANIAAFGGDPANVTIAGESAGARSVTALLASPLAAGLFQRAISESGSYTNAGVPLDKARKAALHFGDLAGCAADDADCLRDLPVARILALQSAVPASPIVGADDLPEMPWAAIAAGRFNRVPLIIGWNRDETTWQVALTENSSGKPTVAGDIPKMIGAFAAGVGPKAPAGFVDRAVAAYPLSDYVSPGQALAAVMTDYGIACPSLRMLREAGAYVPVYGYEFADRKAPQFNAPGSFPFGAAHTSELQYLFPGFHGATGKAQGLDPTQQRLARTMRGYWASFAAVGAPTATGAPAWPPYSAKTGDILVLDTPKPFVAGADYGAARHCALWETLGP